MANKTPTFTKQELHAMKDRASELKAEARDSKKREAGEKAVLDAIAQLKGDDKTLVTQLHQYILETAPQLWPKTWYGMPAYTDGKDGNIICFIQPATKFDTRYTTLGFEQHANLDDGNMWATAFAITKLEEKEKKEIKRLLLKGINE